MNDNITHNINNHNTPRKERIGEEKCNKFGTLMKIVEYNNTNDLIVEFQDEYKYRMQSSYSNFKKSNIKNPYDKFLYGRGYFGVGQYKATQNGKRTEAYDAWCRMFTRCYDEKYLKKYTTYMSCEVCEEWWNFQTFAKWFYEHYYQVGDSSMQVDKDWICHHNKVYCPDKCEIVPQIINTCALTHDKIKNFDLPVGIHRQESGGYVARVSMYGKRKQYPTRETIEEAMRDYKIHKIKYINDLAEEYKWCLSNKIYNQMKNFEERFIIDNPEYANI